MPASALLLKALAVRLGGPWRGFVNRLRARRARLGGQPAVAETLPEPLMLGDAERGQALVEGRWSALGRTVATGGGSIWVTGTYDPALNLTYWGTGNPGPDFNPAQRPGDNLYTNSVVALDADTGALKWHFQFTPADRYDWDATQVPVLVDTKWRGSPARLLMLANRNGFFYVLDRVTGKFLLGQPFVKQNWASGLDDNGRPIQTPQPPGATTWPDASTRLPARAARKLPRGPMAAILSARIARSP